MVWTEITRAKYCRDGLRYASDTTDEEWAMIAPYMPDKNRLGRPRVTEMRTLVNSIFFIAQSGCQWRLLPKEFPPYTTVQRYFYRWRDDGTWQKINHHLVMMAREADRKSTRLNSSHLGISYAVFCLKKKQSIAVSVDT